MASGGLPYRTANEDQPMTDEIDETEKPGSDSDRIKAAEGKEQPKPDPALIDPEKTPGSGMTPDDGDAPSG